jgi:hypothetical protein
VNKPKVVLTEWGPVTEIARQQAVINMKLDPAKRQAVLELLCKQMGSVAKGEMEFRARFPELFEEDEKAERDAS